MTTFDLLVIGCGGVGSAALAHAARRGVRVLGLDRFAPPHPYGSSHGETRIIRLAYFEHPNYVPLLRRAYDLWAALEQRTQRTLYTETGLLQLGPPDGQVVPGVLASAAEHQLAVESLTPREIRKKFPGFVVPDDWHGVLEQRAGYLAVEDCVAAHLEVAQADGAQLWSNCVVQSWRPAGSGVVVETDRGPLSARKLVITAGSWAGQLLADLGITLEVRRKPLFWYETSFPNFRQENRCPLFLHETPGGVFYGFPRIEGSGLKVAEHSGGDVVADPLHVDRTLKPADQARIESFLREYLPQPDWQFRQHTVCLYTLSPDLHFLVDQHPAYPQVVFAAGLSGHGFKFTSVLGEQLVERALAGAWTQPLEFLNLFRLATG